jgi:hypothetical protein
MSRSLSGTLLKGIGAGLLVLLVLSVISTVISAVLGFVAAVVSLVITVAVLSAVVLAAFGLLSLLSDGEPSGDADWQMPEQYGGTPDVEQSNGWRKWLPGHRNGSDRVGGGRAGVDDRENRLRERYVAGEIDEAEFERKMDRLLRSTDTETRLNERGLGDSDGSNRDRLWER